MTITPPCCFCSPWLRYVAAGWMQARVFKRERKSELWSKSVNRCWYGPRKKNSVTGGGRYFGHKLGNELDEVVNEHMECLQVETWSVNYVIYFGLFYQNNSIRILPLFYAHTKILNFTKGKIHGSYFNLLCQTPGSRREVISKDYRILS